MRYKIPHVCTRLCKCAVVYCWRLKRRCALLIGIIPGQVVNKSIRKRVREVTASKVAKLATLRSCPILLAVLPFCSVALSCTALPYCAIAAEGEGPATDNYFRQLPVLLQGRAVHPSDVQFDHSVVAPQGHRHVQIGSNVVAQGTATKQKQ